MATAAELQQLRVDLTGTVQQLRTDFTSELQSGLGTNKDVTDKLDAKINQLAGLVKSRIEPLEQLAKLRIEPLEQEVLKLKSASSERLRSLRDDSIIDKTSLGRPCPTPMS